MTKENKMLPSGFHDLLFDEANKDYYIKSVRSNHFLDEGFSIVNTPLLEFRENFTRDQLKKSFSTVDAISGDNLVIRSDITLQIARLLETRLKNISLPLKLCYEGDVLVTKNDELYSDRQLTQSGFEIIGCKENDFLQIVETSVSLVSKLVDKKSTLEISLPGFSKILCDSMNIDYNKKIRDAIKRKNLTDIAKLLDKDAGSLFCDLLTNFTDLHSIVSRVSENNGSQDVLVALSRLSSIKDLVENKYGQILGKNYEDQNGFADDYK